MADEATDDVGEGAEGGATAEQQSADAEANKDTGGEGAEGKDTGDKSEDKGDGAGGDPEKGAEDKSEDKSEDDEEDKSDGAPDQYEAFTLPEGMPVDEERLERFSEFAKGKNFTQEEAQELVTMHAETVQQISEAIIADQSKQWDAVKEGWAKDAKADKALQGEDGKIDEALSVAKNAALKLGGQDLVDAMDLTGLGDHPAAIKAFYTLGQYISEEGEFSFGVNASDRRSRAEKMYPSMKNQK